MEHLLPQLPDPFLAFSESGYSHYVSHRRTKLKNELLGINNVREECCFTRVSEDVTVSHLLPASWTRETTDNAHYRRVFQVSVDDIWNTRNALFLHRNIEKEFERCNIAFTLNLAGELQLIVLNSDIMGNVVVNDFTWAMLHNQSREIPYQLSSRGLGYRLKLALNRVDKLGIELPAGVSKDDLMANADLLHNRSVREVRDDKVWRVMHM